MEFLDKAVKILKEGYVCDNCLGRILAGQLLSGFTNKERGRTIRQFMALLIDSGEKIDANESNFYGIKFRSAKLKPEKPEKCKVCKNFFLDQIDEIAEKIMKKLKEFEFDTFQIGSMPSAEMIKNEERLWSEVGIENCESIKSEINRELGKIIEKKMKKRFVAKNPDVTIVFNFNTNVAKVEVRSLYIFGRYQKLVRGIPQTTWICSSCRGKGCKKCKGEGKLYKTSVQEIIEKPLLKVAKSKGSKFHGAGREDIDARCLAHRPFVIELTKPLKRKIDLKKIEKVISKSKKVKVKNLKFVSKDVVNRLKFAKIDKTYLAIIEFEKALDKKKLRELKKLTEMPIIQKTPLRVKHRRADKFRKRLVKKISWKLLNRKTLEIKIRSEAGLYIKELITGDEGRTKPSIAEMLNNKVKKIMLDVIKIHSEKL